jgi:hypothetical protein
MLADHRTIQHASSCVRTTIEPQSGKRATYLRSAIAMALLGPAMFRFVGQGDVGGSAALAGASPTPDDSQVRGGSEGARRLLRTGPEKVRPAAPWDRPNRALERSAKVVSAKLRAQPFNACKTPHS